MNDPGKETDPRGRLAEDYASFAQARRALGSAWAGVIALWPSLLHLLTNVFPGLDHVALYRVSAYLSVLGLLLWVGGRALLARSFYRPLGWTMPRPAPGEGRWNLLALLVVLGCGLALCAQYWSASSHHLWPPTQDLYPLLVLRRQVLWLMAVLWVGLWQLDGWEDRLVFIWLGLLGVRHIALLHQSGILGPVLILGGLASLVLAPWLIVRGIREHRRFRRIVGAIQALPCVEP
jgi:hypothetical protein